MCLQEKFGAWEIDFGEVKKGRAIDEGHYSVVHDGTYRGQRVAIKFWKAQTLSKDLLTLFSREVTNMR